MSTGPGSMTEIPLLRTKLSPPLTPPEFVHRPRLVAQINRGIRGPLTLLSAPAGFGKTHLLVEWAMQSPLPVAWLTLDQEDNDLVRFYRYFISALQEIDPQCGDEALDFIHATKGGSLDVALTLLLNEFSALSQEVVLVIDEFNVVESPAILHSLTYLIKHLPGRMHLVIASRVDPELDLPYLRAKRWVTEITEDDLRFTVDEVSLFFNQTMGLQLPPETVRALEQRTEGWITALQMAAISLRSQQDPDALLAGFHGDAHYLVDFLAEEVLDRQPEQIRRFLLRTSILDVLSGPLCEAVVDPAAPAGTGARLLDTLEHANLFIAPLDQQHEWFRYHRLFADFLRHIEDETEAALVPVLHRRAAAWFVEHGNLEEAFRHALATGDEDWAAGVIEKNSSALIKTGDLHSLIHWIEQLPIPAVRQRPLLSLVYVWGLIASYQLDQAKSWLDDLEYTLEEEEPREAQALPPGHPAHPRQVKGWVAMTRYNLALVSGDLQKAAAYSEMALKFLDEDNLFTQSLVALDESMYYVLLGDTAKAIEKLRWAANLSRRSNNLLGRVVANAQIAEMQAMQGHLSQALATLRKVQSMTLGPDGRPLPLAAIADSTIGEILRERELPEARQYLERSANLAESVWSLNSLDSMVSLARLLQSQGDYAGSQKLIAAASRLALSTESSRWDDTFVTALAARLALMRGDLEEASQWLGRSGLLDPSAELSPENYLYDVFEFLLLTQVRYFLALGRQSGDRGLLRKALELLQSILPQVERYERVTSRIELLVLQSLVEAALGDQDLAVRTLLGALALGEPEDYRRIFLDEGGPVADLLERCLQAQRSTKQVAGPLPSPGYIESLLSSLEGGREERTLSAQDGSRGQAPAVESQAESGYAVTGDGESVMLSAREIEVLKLIADGKSNQEISEQLFLALNTVKRHAYNIYAKLGVGKRTQAVSKARQLGLIP